MSRPRTELRGPLVPHKTRVVVRGGAAGMVIGVRNARRRLLGVGSRVDEPAMVTVILDSGRRVVEPVVLVEVEVVSEAGASTGQPVSLTADPGDECDRECCA